MPLVRLEVRNVYGLEKTELHSNVEREDTKAILDGVAVSGLVGILRQLGDLTEFAAEIFHGIQEEVMVTSSRSSKLKMRLKQIEATVPSIQKKVIAQTNHIHFAYTGGLEWHPRIPNVQNQFIYDDLPQFVMAPYEDSRDPPRLHLLDKFDVNGPGSCLKRYSDPTHFKSASRATKLPETKKKKSVQRNRDISSLASIANQKDRKASTCLSFSGRTSSSKSPSTKPDFQDHRSCSLDSRSGGEKKPKGVFTSSRTIASVLSDTESEDANDSLSQDQRVHGSCCVSWHEKAEIVEMDALQCAAEEAPQVIEATNSVSDADPMLKEHKEVEAVQDIKPMGMEMDSESEGDDFVDAPYTIDSESENDQNNEEAQKKSSNEITEEELENSLREEQETGKISNNFSDDEIICAAAASDIRNGTHSFYSNGFSNPLYDTDGIQEHQESEDETSCDTEATKLWTNGNLVGVKPKIVAEVIPENDEDTDAETFQEPLREDDNKAYFDWFASSPQLDHMKISFNHSETLQSSELKLKLAEEDTFPSFQLVPETQSRAYEVRKRAFAPGPQSMLKI
uniref:Protein SCAR n=1 Tax=Noccaea caerulescens TaxID=107243 RepID=A0A1J3JFX4_NOCCA